MGDSHFRKVMQSRGKKQANTTRRREGGGGGGHAIVKSFSRVGCVVDLTCGGCRVIVRRNAMNEGRMEESLTDASHNHKKGKYNHYQFHCFPLKNVHAI